MLFPINNLNQHHTRGHKQRIFKTHSRLLIGKNSVSQRIVDRWNSLPEYVVNAHNVNSFKHGLNMFLKNHPVKFQASCYGPETRLE